jgi:hypothetical protein
MGLPERIFQRGITILGQSNKNSYMDGAGIFVLEKCYCFVIYYIA